MPMTHHEAMKVLNAVLGTSHDIPKALCDFIFAELKRSRIIVRKKFFFFEVVVTNHSDIVISALRTLYTKPDLFTDFICWLVITSSANSKTLADAIVYLSRFTALVELENILLLKAAKEHGHSLAFAMGGLYKLNPQLCQLENFQKLLAIKNTGIRYYGNIFTKLKRLLRSEVFTQEMLQEFFNAEKVIVNIYKAIEHLDTKNSNIVTKRLLLVLLKVKNYAEELAQYLNHPPLDVLDLDSLVKILADHHLIISEIYKTYLKIRSVDRISILSAMRRLSAAKLYNLDNIIILLTYPDYADMFYDSKHFKFRSLERLFDSGTDSHFLGLQTAVGVPIKMQALDILCRLKEAEQDLASVTVELPTALDPESAMATKRINEAYENLVILYEQYGHMISDHEDIIKFECQIREKLLLDIRNAAKEQYDLGKEILNNTRILKFLTDVNIASLARRSCAELNKAARELLCKRDDTTMTTYRAYDSQAVCSGWDNLLSPDKLEFPSDTFCPRTKPVAFQELSRYVRIYAVACYLASIDERLSVSEREAIWRNFKCYIAEIRRAHSKNVYEIDKISCFPGTLTRLSLIASFYPYCKKPTLLIDSLIVQRIKFIVNRELSSAFSRELTVTDKEKLFFSLTMLGIDNAQEVIKNEEEVYTSLLDDSPSYIKSCLEKRAIFISNLKLRDIIADISEYLTSLQQVFNIHTYFLVVKNFLQLRTLVDLSYSQIRSIQHVDEDTTQMDAESFESDKETKAENFPAPSYTPGQLSESIERFSIPDEEKKYRIARLIMREYWIPLFKHAEYQLYREYCSTLGEKSETLLTSYANIINEIINFCFEDTQTFTTKQKLISHLLGLKITDILEKIPMADDGIFSLEQVLTTMIRPMYARYAQCDESDDLKEAKTILACKIAL